MSELALFLEGSRVVGRIALVPAESGRKQLNRATLSGAMRTG
jgi:hypothetical protein